MSVKDFDVSDGIDVITCDYCESTVLVPARTNPAGWEERYFMEPEERGYNLGWFCPDCKNHPRLKGYL